MPLTPLPTTTVPLDEHADASPSWLPPGQVMRVCTPSLQIAPWRNPVEPSCHPTTTLPSALQPLARVLRPVTVEPRLTMPVAACQRIACADPALIQPRPTTVVPSPEMPQPLLASPPDEDPMPPSGVHVCDWKSKRDASASPDTGLRDVPHA